jgi:hypothetical protein
MNFSFGNLLLDPLMWPCPIEIRNIGPQDTIQLLLVQDQHVIQAFSSDTSQESFTDRIGAFRVIGRFEYLDAAHGSRLERNRAQTCYHDRE